MQAMATKSKSTAKKVAPKKPAAKKPAKSAKAPAVKSATKPAPLGIDALLARSRQVIAGINQSGHARVVESIAARCITARRPDLATALGENIPAPFRGVVLAMSAVATKDAAAINAAVDAIVNAEPDGRDRPAWAVAAFRAATVLAGASKRTAELAKIVDSIVEEAFSEDPPWGDHSRFRALVELFELQCDGATKALHAMLTRALAQYPAEIGKALATGTWLWKIDGSPKLMLKLVESIESNDRYQPLTSRRGLRACTSWSMNDLATLVAFDPAIRSDLGKELAEAGRRDEARAIMFPPKSADDDWVDPTFVAQDYLAIGDAAAAKKVLSEPTQAPIELTRLKIELGIETIQKALTQLTTAKLTAGVMSRVGELVALGELAVKRGELAHVDAILAASEKLLASKQGRIPHDAGVEGGTRNEVADLRANIAVARGGADAARTSIVADIAGIPALQAFGKDSWKKQQLALDVMRRALRHGAPDLALQVAKKVKFDAGTIHQTAFVAAGFLPADPGAALNALDTLAKGEADKHLVFNSIVGEAPFQSILDRLWSAVLSQQS